MLRRMNLVKRKGTKQARKLPEKFDEIKTNFLKQMHKTIEQFNVLLDLIVNLDETGCKFVPVTEGITAAKGSKQVDIA